MIETANETSEIAALQSCAACGETLQGKFCHRCGEKILDRSDHAFKTFFADLLIYRFLVTFYAA